MKYPSKRGNALWLAIGMALVLSYWPSTSSAQDVGTDSPSQTLESAGLESIIAYALKHQPNVQQSVIDEKITENQIQSKLADWYPQVNFSYNYQHNFVIQTSIIAGNPVKLGVKNTSATQLTLSQQIFNRDVLLANRTKQDVQLRANQNTTNTKIDLTANVSKAFYDVLATTEQINVATEDIRRLERSLKDANNQYQAGITDKIDVKRATITLNNTRASKKSSEEVLKAKIEYLKSLMGYPENEPLQIAYDTLQMERELFIDTTQGPTYNQRIEYQILETQKRLAQANLQYNKWSFLPTITLNGAYNMNFQNNQFTDLYGQRYPNSYGLITVSLPLLQGGKRKANVSQAKWQLKRADLDLVNLKNNIRSEYTTALATYQSNLTSLLAQKENVSLAEEVYQIIQLQYRSGLKAYLEVVTAETDLRLARINYYNALYDVLSSKIDVQRAQGQFNN
ncbi:outer membrane protein TolC [Dyadobacter jejuensis]|uniref:Outer membrane protein TolC n=1 Tax=Dyadobacter jejuensis TaxID=1082580 RepID=A0A316AK82_9BACT|nr:TolC family protein [Dyadobacter jejuensis]PWJ57424.1 outer membrane protein TolC [Dyadobacter jejuensis]